MSSAEARRGDASLIDEVEVAEGLGCPLKSVARMVAAGSVFFVERDGLRLYPSFFADPALDRRQLSAVAKLLGSWDNLAKWRFFVSGKGSLGGLTPLEALRHGKFREVKVAAEGFATR